MTNAFDKIINKELLEENSEMENKLTKSLSKIDNFELEISKKKINKKYKKYSKLHDKMMKLHLEMNQVKSDLDESFKNVDLSVSTILNIGNVKKYVSEGDSILTTNSRLAKQSYNKAIRLSEKLMGVGVIDQGDVDYIKEKVQIANSLYTTEYVKDTMSSVGEYLDGHKDLDNVISRLGKVDFNKMNSNDISQVNKLVTEVLDNRPTKLGNLVKSLKSNETNTNTIELKLI